MKMILETGQLTKEVAESNMVDLLALSSVCWPEIGQEAWLKDNFLSDFPLKWQLSRYAVLPGSNQIVGCVIGYQRNQGYGPMRKDGLDYGFVAKVAVLPEYRGEKASTNTNQKISVGLMNEFESACIRNSIPEIRLGVLKSNTRAISLYASSQYEIMGIHNSEDGQTRSILSKILLNPAIDAKDSKVLL